MYIMNKNDLAIYKIDEWMTVGNYNFVMCVGNSNIL